MIGFLPRRLLPLIRTDHGTAVTEFVVTLPLLLIFLFGLTGIAQAIWYHHIITKGVRDGTRYLSRMPLTTEFRDNAKRVAMTGSPSGMQAFSFWHETSTIDVTTTTVANSGTFRTPGPVTIVQMTATVPVDIPILRFNLLGLAPNVTFAVTDEARWIGE